MREILFRGKRVDNGKWVYGSLLTFTDGKNTILPSTSTAWLNPETATIRCDEYYDVTPDTVGQYTGLTDKYGVRIFEGDILESHYDDIYPDDISIETILWNGNGWSIQEAGYTPYQLPENGILTYSKIIGNIHDNPELLEGGEHG